MADFAATDQEEAAVRNDGDQDPQASQIVAFNPQPAGLITVVRQNPLIVRSSP